MKVAELIDALKKMNGSSEAWIEIEIDAGMAMSVVGSVRTDDHGDVVIGEEV